VGNAGARGGALPAASQPNGSSVRSTSSTERGRSWGRGSGAAVHSRAGGWEAPGYASRRLNSPLSCSSLATASAELLLACSRPSMEACSVRNAFTSSSASAKRRSRSLRMPPAPLLSLLSRSLASSSIARGVLAA